MCFSVQTVSFNYPVTENAFTKANFAV